MIFHLVLFVFMLISISWNLYIWLVFFQPSRENKNIFLDNHEWCNLIFSNVMVKIRFFSNLRCIRVRKYNELHKLKVLTWITRYYVRDVSIMNYIYFKFHKILWNFYVRIIHSQNDSTTIYRFFKEVLDIIIFLIRLQIEVRLIPNKHLKFSCFFGI